MREAHIPTYEELINKPPIKTVDISTPQTKGSYKERRNQILSNSAEVIKKPYLNADTQSLIFLTPKSYNHAFNNLGALQLNAAEHLPEFIETAVLTFKNNPDHGDANATGVYTFFAAARNGKNVLPVKLKVKEIAINGQDIPRNVKEYIDSNSLAYNFVYDSVVLEVLEIEESSSGSAIGNSAEAEINHSPQELYEVSVSELLSLVNENYQKYIPKPLNTDDEYIRQNQQRKQKLTDRYVLSQASQQIDRSQLTEEQAKALDTFDKYLAESMELRAQRDVQNELIRKYRKENNNDELVKAENRRNILSGKISRVDSKMLTFENTAVAKQILKKSREIIETAQDLETSERLEKYYSRQLERAAQNSEYDAERNKALKKKLAEVRADRDAQIAALKKAKNEKISNIIANKNQRIDEAIREKRNL